MVPKTWPKSGPIPIVNIVRGHFKRLYNSSTARNLPPPSCTFNEPDFSVMYLRACGRVEGLTTRCNLKENYISGRDIEPEVKAVWTPFQFRNTELLQSEMHEGVMTFCTYILYLFWAIFSRTAFDPTSFLSEKSHLCIFLANLDRLDELDDVVDAPAQNGLGRDGGGSGGRRRGGLRARSLGRRRRRRRPRKVERRRFCRESIQYCFRVPNSHSINRARKRTCFLWRLG